MKVCTRCGAQNEDSSRHCTQCNAVLPNISSSVTQVPKPPDKVYERYEHLREAGEKVLEGEITIEEYADFVEEISHVLAQREEEIRDVEIPDDAYEDFSEELELGFQGISLYNEGIAHMLMYVEDQDPEHIRYGLELVYEGNESINDAMKINRDNRRKLEEMIDNSRII